MDLADLKQHAKQLHSFLKPQLGPAFKLGQAQELVATLVGLRSWSEVLASPGQLKSIAFDDPSLEKLIDRIDQQYAASVSPEGLRDALAPSADPMMMPTPRPAIITGRIPRRWICDVCGQYIDSVDRAYVVWKGSGMANEGFRIIHQSDCDIDDSFHSSNPVRDYVGQEGLNRLLSFFSAGPLQKGSRFSVGNPDEIVDFIRRCQIPNYDLARGLFNDPRVLQEFREAGAYLPYQPEVLAQVVKDFGEKE